MRLEPLPLELLRYLKTAVGADVFENHVFLHITSRRRFTCQWITKPRPSTAQSGEALLSHPLYIV